VQIEQQKGRKNSKLFLGNALMKCDLCIIAITRHHYYNSL